MTRYDSVDRALARLDSTLADQNRAPYLLAAPDDGPAAVISARVTEVTDRLIQREQTIADLAADARRAIDAGRPSMPICPTEVLMLIDELDARRGTAEVVGLAAEQQTEQLGRLAVGIAGAAALGLLTLVAAAVGLVRIGGRRG